MDFLLVFLAKESVGPGQERGYLMVALAWWFTFGDFMTSRKSPRSFANISFRLFIS